MQTPNALGLDARSLDGLRGQASKDPKSATRQAAVQMESHFMQMVLKSMREASPKADGGESNDTFTQMLDQQFSRQFSGRPGGLADMIEKQLNAQMKGLPASPQAPAAATPTSAPSSTPAAAVGPLSSRGKPANPQAFLESMLPHAQAAERATGVPASFILGQAALESGWGKGEIRHADGSGSHNLFGIKATGGWRGDVATTRTTEYVGGQAVRQDARFRSYGSYAEAFTDYARMLATSPRYAQAVRSDSAEGFAGAMQRAGYATDPQYAAKLARTINHTLALQRALA